MTNDNALQDLKQNKLKVLLIDDQAMVGEAVRRMLENEDMEFKFCQDPTQAIDVANTFCPSVILQDLVMPKLDGLTLVKFLRINPSTQKTPLIVLSTKEDAKVKADAFQLGANDYLVKLPDQIELLARVRYHATNYNNLLERDRAFEAVIESRKKLEDDLNEASRYVTGLLPDEITDGDIKTSWKFKPCEDLGGDAFGYHMIDNNHFGIYLLDVCGHGVKAALLSITVINVLKAQSLKNADFKKPSEVLSEMNETFQMQDHSNMYFTMWYGVYNLDSKTLTYASGGHPPALLITANNSVQQLDSTGLIVGGLPGMPYEEKTVTVNPGDQLHVFSDGVYEIQKDEVDLLDFDGFIELILKHIDEPDHHMENVWKTVTQLNESETLDDDYSILKVTFS